jgi:hypothetical protein
MLGEPAKLGITLGLALLSATFFLFLGCHGKGRVFGPHSRWLALMIISLTGVVSLGVAAVAHLLRDSVLPQILGTIVPGGLWLSQALAREDNRGTLAKDATTFWLVSLLRRLHAAMAEDQADWCESRVDETWTVHELGMAARRYHERIAERLPAEERRKERLNLRLQAIEARLDVAALIEDGAPRSKVTTALGGSRHTKQVRYERYLHESNRLHAILCHDAQRELVRLLTTAYKTGFRSLPGYKPPARRLMASEGVRPHP